MTALVEALYSTGPHGTCSTMREYSAPKLYQKISCTSTGTLRKNQM